MKFTEEQQKAIDIRDSNILVSAAAGSGKTAVLVERILKLVCDRERPLDVDRLLVVTFTNAAAAGMRRKIGAAIRKKLLEEPGNEHLQKQTALLQHAHIMTVHSFCLSVLRDHFQKIGLDPSFAVADEGELNLLKKEVVKELLEDRFAAGEKEFYGLVEAFAPKKTDDILEDYILDLYRFAMSYPWPEKWLKKCGEAYDIPEETGVFDLPFMEEEAGRIRDSVEELLEMAGEAAALCMEEDGPSSYLEPTLTYQDFLTRLAACRDFGEYEAVLRGGGLKPLTGKRAPKADEWKKNRVKNLRNEIKDAIEKLKEQYFFTGERQMLCDMRACRDTARCLVSLVLEFMERFDAAKREKNLVDFNDLEHMTLHILAQEQDGRIRGTEEAAEYRDSFEEVLIDEYQDSNLVQESLLSAVSRQEEGRRNYVMVGDVKQSIYRFRLARPEIFMEKFRRYRQDEGPERKVILGKNFRSRREILECVNFIMKQIMGERLGGISYDRDAALYPGAAYPESEEAYRAELLLAFGGGEEGLSGKELEARMVAQRIRELVGRMELVTEEFRQDGEKAAASGRVYRKARYSDIVILLRSNKGWDEVFHRVLTEAGIPVHVSSRTGYFAAPEVRAVLDFLRVIDNPLQDIPLADVLKTVWGGFDDEGLALLSAGRQGVRLYERLSLCEEASLREKCASFLELLEKYRNQAAYSTVYEILLNLYEEREFYLHVSAMPSGRQRAANLDMLLERARAYEKISYKGLFNFIRYMEGLEKYQVDFGEANVLGEQDDAVRIMSIHKSKGLEFPICFVSGIQKKFNETDLRKSMLMDMDLGLSMDYVDPVRRTKTATILKKVMQQKGRLDGAAEELRLLYVAMTRAMEKLILTGYTQDPAALWDRRAAGIRHERELLDMRTLAGSGSYLELIYAALARYPAFRQAMREAGAEADLEHCFAGELPPLDIRLFPVTEQLEGEVAEAMTQGERRGEMEELLREAAKGTVFSGEERKRLDQYFQYRYPYEAPSPLYTKISVTELKRMEHGETDGYELYREPVVTPYLPRFVEEREEIQGTERGNAYHKVMELWDYGASAGREQVEAALHAMALGGRLTQQQRALVAPGDICVYLDTLLAKRVAAAFLSGKLYREQPFVIGCPADRLDPSFPGEETILVQGIIDLYFEEEGELCVVDYKTDRGKTAEELKSLYGVQLNYYAQALEQMTGKRVREQMIYSFALGAVVPL